MTSPMMQFFETFLSPLLAQGRGAQQQQQPGTSRRTNRDNSSANADTARGGSSNSMHFFPDPDFLSMMFGGGHGQGFFDASAQAGVPPGFGFPEGEASRHPGAPPPCSRRALAQLPRVSVAPADLVIDNNRLCSICLESHSLGQVVLRLPCAHLFHPECIVPWLESSCVCPVCRFELPTDCMEYERDRLQRMRSRKPRFYDHELPRLTVAQLKSLGRKPPGCLEKGMWIQHLIDSHAIDVIPSPPPVVLDFKQLQQMSTSQLKQQMQDAGVFYDPKFVVEKSDLLAIFCGSGRLLVTNTDDDDDEKEPIDETDGVTVGFCGVDTDRDSATASQVHLEAVSATRTRTERGRSVVIETVYHDDENKEKIGVALQEEIEEEYTVVLQEVPYQQEGDEGLAEWAMTPMENSSSDATHAADNAATSDLMMKTDDENGGKFEAVSFKECWGMDRECETLAVEEKSVTVGEDSAAGPVYLETVKTTRTSIVQSRSGVIETMQHEDEKDGKIGVAYFQEDFDANLTIVSQEVPSQQEDDNGMAALTITPIQKSSSDAACSTVNAALSDLMNKKRKRSQRSPDVASRSEVSPTSDLAQRFSSWSLFQLRAYARELSVDLSKCLERRDIIEQLVLASRTWGVDEWSTCEIRAVASLMALDLASFDSQRALVNAVMINLTETRHASYILGMQRLKGKSVRQLRDTAKDWRVDVADCVEKTEIIQRLLLSHRQLKRNV